MQDQDVQGQDDSMALRQEEQDLRDESYYPSEAEA
jgi:hypothetical protein